MLYKDKIRSDIKNYFKESDGKYYGFFTPTLFYGLIYDIDHNGMLFAPSIIPSIAMVTMYKQFVENAIPAFAKTIFGVAMSGLLQNPDTTFGSIIFYNIWVGFGVGILLYLGAMQSPIQSWIVA